MNKYFFSRIRDLTWQHGPAVGQHLDVAENSIAEISRPHIITSFPELACIYESKTSVVSHLSSKCSI